MRTTWRGDLTPAELDAARAHEAATRKSRAKPGAQKQVRLDPDQRLELAYLDSMNLWSLQNLADAFGVSTKAVRTARRDHERTR